MQLTQKLKNKSVPYSLLLKPRVGTVVSNEGSFYTNVSGINSVLSDENNWFKFYSNVTSKEIDKTAANISGADPNFYIDLSADSLPPFPTSIKVYIDLIGDGNYMPSDPANYNPITKTLGSMNSDADFPDQRVKILVI